MAAFSLLEVKEETANGERHWCQGAEKAIWAWEPKPCYLLLREMTEHQPAQEGAFTHAARFGKGKTVSVFGMFSSTLNADEADGPQPHLLFLFILQRFPSFN